MPRELRDVDVRLISFVRRGANKKKFVIFKSEDAGTSGDPTPEGEEKEDEMTPELKEALEGIRADVANLRKTIAEGDEGDTLEIVTDETAIDKIAGYFTSALENLQAVGADTEKGKKTKADLVSAVRAKLLEALREVPKEHRKGLGSSPKGGPTKAAHPRSKEEEAADKKAKDKKDADDAKAKADKDAADAKKAVPSQGDAPNVSAGAGAHRDDRNVGNASDMIDPSVGKENETAIAEALKELKEGLLTLHTDVEGLKKKPGTSHVPSGDSDAGVAKGLDPDDTGVGSGWPSDMAADNKAVVKKMAPLVDNGFEAVAVEA